MNAIDQHEIRYRIFQLLSKDPRRTQRQMAEEMGVSLGKLNYCLTELAKKGFLKINRFKSSDNKAAYRYILTPHGLEEKTRTTAHFLRRKMVEFEEIQKQIAEIMHSIDAEGQEAMQVNDGRGRIRGAGLGLGGENNEGSA